MDQQQLNKYLQLYNNILKQVISEVNKLYSKQEEIIKREQNILEIKDNTIQILELLKEQKNRAIQRNIRSLNKVMELDHKSTVLSVLELKDLRLATGDFNGYIRLFSIDYEQQQWIKANEHKGHNDGITSLCELSGNKLISSSDDNTLKLWNLNYNTISLIKTLNGNDWMYQVIPLTNNIIASGSKDKTIKIWELNSFREIRSLQEDFEVFSLLKLRNKNIMVSAGWGKSISFWNINTFTKEHSVTCCGCFSLNGLIELPNHCVAVSGGGASTIDIIDTNNYQRIKQIQCKDYIVSSLDFSSIHLLKDGTFIYSHEGRFCQISSTTYEIIVKIQKEDEFVGSVITSSSNGKFVIANNNKYGISIFKVGYT